MEAKTYALKPEIDLTAFLRKVDVCSGKILFESSLGDRLDLKSQLSKYLLLSAAADPVYLHSGRVRCSAGDALLLSDFL